MPTMPTTGTRPRADTLNQPNRPDIPTRTMANGPVLLVGDKTPQVPRTVTRNPFGTLTDDEWTDSIIREIERRDAKIERLTVENRFLETRIELARERAKKAREGAGAGAREGAGSGRWGWLVWAWVGFCSGATVTSLSLAWIIQRAN